MVRLNSLRGVDTDLSRPLATGAVRSGLRAVIDLYRQCLGSRQHSEGAHPDYTGQQSAEVDRRAPVSKPST